MLTANENQSDVEEWSLFEAALRWRPIADYDPASGTVLFRRGRDLFAANDQDWVIGYYGLPYDYRADEAARLGIPIAGSTFRHSQDHLRGVPLGFEPNEFVEIDDDWRERLIQD